MSAPDGFRIDRVLEYPRILNLYSVIIDCNADSDVVADIVDIGTIAVARSGKCANLSGP
jgi:hypothetical protein